jgi:hypothetical protein
MTGWDELDRFLQTDPRDVGCDQALHILHVYVELVLVDASGTEGGPAAPRGRRAPAQLRAVRRGLPGTAPGRPGEPVTGHLQARR